ncbi:spore germination protein [Bacillus kwashiorkori]|uniref:spore germination protein n=1 Tax=Bacillus kwashiorkori TaxID=1522318 RepID=UPI000783B06D|nr:spore germination protein [Bacillus kwashiorkori]
MVKQTASTNANQQLIELVNEKFNESFDFMKKQLQIDNSEAMIMYIKTVVDGTQLQEIIIKPFFEMKSSDNFLSYLNSLPQQQEIKEKEQVIAELTKGSVLIFVKQQNILIDLKSLKNNNVLETNIEPTILGQKLGLSESIEVNINLIRQQYHQPSLIVEMKEIGQKVHKALAIIYDKDTVNQAVLKNIREKISKLDLEVIHSSSELQRFLNDYQRSLLPTMMVTERTDRIVTNLAGGKVIILVNGSPTVVIAPAVFFDFMTSMEDNFQLFWVTRFTKVLRFFGLFVCLLLPGLYVAVTSFNPEFLRAELALSVAGSRIGVPYPSFIEVLFLLIFMEFLTEASIRLPKAISGTATTVGGLILGTAATEAALTSNIMVIIVSAVAIATFAIPINEMSFGIRIVRYFLLLFSTIAGLLGLILSFLGFVMYLANKNSFGEPYLKLFIQRKKAEVKGAKS